MRNFNFTPKLFPFGKEINPYKSGFSYPYKDGSQIMDFYQPDPDPKNFL